MPKLAPYYVIDLDAGDEPFSKTKQITADVADALVKLDEVTKNEIRYTGKRGFHVLGWLKKPRDVDSAREFLKTWLRDTFGQRDDVVVGESPVGKKCALGLSPMKVNGGQVAKWSLRVSGLCCVEVPRSKLMSFEKEDASIEKTYKKATGRAFSFAKLAGMNLISSDILAMDAAKTLINEPVIHAGSTLITIEGTPSEKLKLAAVRSKVKMSSRGTLTDLRSSDGFQALAREYRNLDVMVANVLYGNEKPEISSCPI
jgi:hypothetical protein